MARVQYVALGGGPEHHDLLPLDGVAHWKSIAEVLAKNWTDAGQQARIGRMSGCLDKLSAALLQANRLHKHHDRVVRMAAANRALPAGASFAIRGIEILADFEGLLLQGRAALDRLAWFLAAELGSQNTSFRKLRKVSRKAGASRTVGCRWHPPGSMKKDPARNYGFISAKGRVRFPLNQSPAFDLPLPLRFSETTHRQE
jgi:hypothetical protein